MDEPAVNVPYPDVLLLKKKDYQLFLDIKFIYLRNVEKFFFKTDEVIITGKHIRMQ